MPQSRCAARCRHCHGVSRRSFLSSASAAVLSAPLLARAQAAADRAVRPVERKGPGARCTPSVKACFVRRKGDYGMRWPGAVYDGEAARKKYTGQIQAAAKELGLELDLRPQPIYSDKEADAWVAEAREAKPDGLLVVLLDRQRHAWPTAYKAVDTKLPTVIFSPVGSSFTTNTGRLSNKPGCFIASTDDFAQARYGLKMLEAGTRMRAARCIVLRGSKEAEATMHHLGITLHYLPARLYLDAYRKTSVDPEVEAMADDYMRRARRQAGASREDVLNGARGYVAARSLLEEHQADAITMDCLGAVGPTKLSLPCLAWSNLNDQGVPAACEADLGAVASHTLVQYLFERPGFQQDPVAETARVAIIGAHCSCPTRLKGFGQPPEPFDLVHHHGMRDATARPLWKKGQRVTSVDVLPSGKGQPSMLISAGQVVGNVDVPPAGGCVVSVMVKFDGVEDVLGYPGFHQIFFYGDLRRELEQFCQLFGIRARVV
ncbi:MAG: hypothetical protein ACOC8A_00795 [bacterium]